MKYLPTIAGILLGLLFVMASAVFLFNLVKPPLPSSDLETKFTEVFMHTGYMTFIKVFELIGGILVAIPRTRNYGLLVLGPIIINILAYNAFIMKGQGMLPMLIIVVPALYLLWVGRKAFAGLLN